MPFANKKTVVCIAVFLLVYVSFSVLAIKRNSLWNNPIDLWEQNRELYPDSIDVLNNLGKAYSDQGRYQESIAAYQASLDLKRYQSIPYANVAFVYCKTGQVDAAIQILEKAKQYSQFDKYMHNNLGMAYLQKKDTQKAMKEFEQACVLDPSFFIPYFNMGEAYRAQRQYDKAISYYQQALKRNPYCVKAHQRIQQIGAKR